MGSDRLCRVKSSTTVNYRFISATLDGLITGGAYIGEGCGVVGVISIIKHIVTQLATILVVAGKASLLKLLFLIIIKK